MKASRMLRRTAPIVALLLAGIPARVAAAPEPSQLAAAQALYEAATKAMDAGDYATACPKLEEVVRLVPEGMGAKLTLARCHEGAGKLASAWTLYSVVEAAERGKERGERAGERAAALRPRIAELTIVVPEAVQALAGLEVRREGIVVGPAQWGLAIPVDKGVYVLSATATGKRRWERTVRVEAEGAKVEVVIGPLEDERSGEAGAVKKAPAAVPAQAPAKTVPARAAARPVVAAPPRVEKATAAPWGAQRTAGLVVGGAGVAAIGVGSYFGVRAMSKRDESNADGHCDDANQCDDIGFPLREEAQTAGTVSTVLFVAGGVAVAGGVTLLLTAPGRERPAQAEIAVGPQGMTLRGRW